MKVLVTGATSFVGRSLIKRLLEDTEWDVVALLRPPRREVARSTRLRHVYHDLRAPFTAALRDEIGHGATVVHAGAEVSAIRSLTDPVAFSQTNVLGTFHTLEASRALRAPRFIYVSTGEAVGAAAPGQYLAEDAPLRPSNPYAASKAAGEELVRAYHRSFGVPGVIVRSMNLFGPAQGLERFIPYVVKQVKTNQPVVCHVDRQGRPGSRNWLHVGHFTNVLRAMAQEGQPGETYHVVGPERTNREVIELVGTALDLEPKIVCREPGPSHDMRYALKDTKLGLDFSADFTQLVLETARWY